MTPPPSSPELNRNRATIVVPASRAERPAPALRQHLQALVDELGPALEVSELPAFAVVAVRLGIRHLRTLVALGDGHLVVGRHTEADVCLDGDPSVSLRHLLIRAMRLEDGTVALRMLDLDTPAGFGVEGGEDVRSLVATGPFAVAVGEWVVVGIPHGRREVSVGGFGGPYRVAAPVFHRAEHVPRQGNHDDRCSHITLLPRADWLGGVPSASLAARLELSSRRGDDTLPITHPMLEHGVLVGRYERCIGHGSRSVTTGTISRTHVLILRNGTEDRVYDLASTGGTFIEGRRVRSAALSRRGSRVRLASDDPVHLRWSTFDS